MRSRIFRVHAPDPGVDQVHRVNPLAIAVKGEGGKVQIDLMRAGGIDHRLLAPAVKSGLLRDMWRKKAADFSKGRIGGEHS